LDRVFQGAASDDISALTDALDGEEDVIEAVLKARDNKGRTVLQAAIVSGALEASKFLCAEGQKWAKRRQFMFELQGQLLERDLGRFINGRDHDGRGALSLLCSASKTSREAVVLLLESQADPMQRDFRGLTPLIECARTGNIGMMKLLLGATRGAALLSTDDQNCSALHWAAKEGQLETVELLVKAGVDAEAADVEGRSAADVAREAGHDEVADLLERAAGDDWESEY
jgi:ankyrin repeat protein